MTRPLALCGHCKAEFLPRRAPSRGQRFCSRSCARRAVIATHRPRRRTGPALAPFLQLLRLGAFERRPRGWRFGTRPISDVVVDRLLAAGLARREGDRLHLVRREARP